MNGLTDKFLLEAIDNLSQFNSEVEEIERSVRAALVDMEAVHDQVESLRPKNMSEHLAWYVFLVRNPWFDPAQIHPDNWNFGLTGQYLFGRGWEIMYNRARSGHTSGFTKLSKEQCVALLVLMKHLAHDPRFRDDPLEWAQESAEFLEYYIQGPNSPFG